MSFLSFLGAAERQVNPFDNGKTAKNTKGNGQNKSVISQIGGEATGLAKGAVAPFAYLAQTDIINPTKELAAQVTGNKKAYANAAKSQQDLLTPQKLAGNVTQIGFDFLAPGVGKAITGAVGKVVPGIAGRVLGGATAGAAIGAPYGVAGAAASGEKLTPGSVAKGALQGAAGGALLGAAGEGAHQVIKSAVKPVHAAYEAAGSPPEPITTHDIHDLAKAETTKDVQRVLGGKVDPATIDKIAPALTETKDPHVISDIVQKNTPPEIPVDTTQAPSIAPAAPSVEKGIQALSNVAKNAKDFNDFQKTFESLPSHPDLQAAVDTVAPHQTLEEFYNSLTGKTPAVDTTIAPSTSPTEGPNTPQQQIIEALTSQNGEKGAGAIRAKQERGYTAERSKRIGAAQGVGKDLSGTEGYYAELAQLKGELPKEEYTGLSDKLNPKQQEDLFTKLRGEIQRHPDINGYSAINAQGALRKVIFGEGGVPTSSEITLLKNAFGEDFSNAVKEDVTNHNARVSTARKAYNTVAEVAGVPRAIMASFDFSGGLRQGLAAATRHPLVFAQAFTKQFKNFASEGAYKESLDAIENHPNYPLMQRARLAIQDIGNGVTNPSAREEQFVSGLAEKIPVLGDIIHASGRAYTGLLNDMRANIFNQLVETSRNAGIDFEAAGSQKLLKQIAEVVNTSTGRGSLGALEGAAKELSTGLFAPRLIASRVQMLNPQYYIKLDPIARKEALTTLLSLGAVATTVLSAAELAGASVEKNPTSADFGKIKIGDTRLDILGGYQQYLRLGAQLATGHNTSSVTGANQTLGKGIAATRFDVLTRFLTNKEAPVPSFITTLLKGKDAAGNPANVPKEVLDRFTPLIGQDIRDLLTHKSSAGLAAAPLGVFGVGLQTYGKQDIAPNTRQKTYLDTLQKNGSSPNTIEAATAFFQTLKVAGGKRQNTSDAINKALGDGNIQKAQQLAQQYNKRYASGFKDWVKQYGNSTTDSQLVKEYNSQKINLTADDIQRRIKTIKDKKAGKL